MLKILVVDDEQGIRELYESTLSSTAVHVTQAASGEEGLDIYLLDPSYDIVITDMNMSGITGAEMVSRMLDQGRPLQVILVTGTKRDEDWAAINSLTARCALMQVLEKPIRPSRLIEAIGKLLLSPGPTEQR